MPDEGPEAAKKVCVAVTLLAMHDLKAMKVTIEYCWMIVSHSKFCMLKLYMRSHCIFDMLQHSLQLATALGDNKHASINTTPSCKREALLESFTALLAVLLKAQTSV